MSSAPAHSPQQLQRGRRLGSTLALLAFAQLIISIDYNIVFVALPEIGEQLGFTSQSLQWVVSSYAVVFGGFLLLGGRASDILGRRRMFVIGLAVYALASLIGGCATSFGVLIAARAVQGIGGALLFPATLSLVTTTFAEGRARNRALAVWSGAGAGGLALGSILGGVLTQGFGWESVFFVNVPLAILAIALAFPLLASDAKFERGRKFDLPGAVSATGGATLLVFTLVQAPEAGWLSVQTLVSAAVSVVLLGLFVVIEHRSSEPLLPLILLRNRNLATGTILILLFTATFGSMLYFLTVYFQDARGYGALKTGLAFLLPTAIVMCGNALGGRLLGKIGSRNTLIASLSVLAVGTALLWLALTPDSSYLDLVPGLVLFGVGGGVTFTALFATASTGVAEQQQGIASGVVSTGQQIGTAVGLAVLVAIANSAAARAASETASAASAIGVRAASLTAAIGIVLMVVVATTLKRQTSHDRLG